jgi:hypothetical protein
MKGKTTVLFGTGYQHHLYAVKDGVFVCGLSFAKKPPQKQLRVMKEALENVFQELDAETK